MHDFITPKERLKEEALQIDAFLNTEIETSSDDLKLHGDEIEEKGNQTAVYVARTGTMLADAKYHLNEILRTDVLTTLIQQMGATYMSATTQKEFIRSACTYETWLVDFIDRLHRTCGKQLDWYRSVLSKYKEELNASRGFHGGS